MGDEKTPPPPPPPDESAVDAGIFREADGSVVELNRMQDRMPATVSATAPEPSPPKAPSPPPPSGGADEGAGQD